MTSGSTDHGDGERVPSPGAQAEAAPPPPRIPLKFEEALAALAMAIICIISLANVIVRYATNASFAFTEEFSVFLLVVMTFLGASVAFARHEHIKITFFLHRMPPAMRRAAELAILAATTLLFALVIYYGATFALDQWEYGEVSAGLGYPSWIYSAWLPVLSLVVLVRIIERAWLVLRRTGRRP